jgi:hypothetical protein
MCGQRLIRKKVCFRHICSPPRDRKRRTGGPSLLLLPDYSLRSDDTMGESGKFQQYSNDQVLLHTTGYILDILLKDISYIFQDAIETAYHITIYKK